MDIGVVIALPEEWEEFYRLLKDRVTVKWDQRTAEPHYVFEVPSKDPSVVYQCVAAVVGDMGPALSALRTQRLIDHWNVQSVVNIGIAGAIDRDLCLGDVVIGEQIDSYLENGKVISEKGGDIKWQFGGKVHRTDRPIRLYLTDALMTRNEAHQKWESKCTEYLMSNIPEEIRNRYIAKDSLRKNARHTVRHIASGSAVVASNDFMNWIKSRDRKCAAVEMEAGGVITATSLYAKPIPTTVLRGISDFSDDRKSKLDSTGGGVFRKYAMHNATQLFLTLLENTRFPMGAEIDTVGSKLAYDSDTLINTLNNLADRYNVTRSAYGKGPARSEVLDKIYEEMKHVSRQLPDLDISSYSSANDRGRRLAAYAYLHEHPQFGLLKELVKSTKRSDNKPWDQHRGIFAIKRMVVQAEQAGGKQIIKGELGALEVLLQQLPQKTKRHIDLDRIIRHIKEWDENDNN